MEWSRDTLWRQGQLLCDDAIEALELDPQEVSDQVFVVVASHDCDLTQLPEREPSIEIIVGRIVPDRDGNCTHAKNSRKLHIAFTGADTVWVEFEAVEKRSIKKMLLREFTPRTDLSLSPEDQAIFQMWLASRYRRSAFPDEFERRLTMKGVKLHEKIANAVKPHGELIVGVFFDVDEGEEIIRGDSSDTYKLDIYILHAAEPDFDAAETAAKIAAEKIAEAFKTKLFAPTDTWQHIELRYCESVSESVLTYQQFKQLKRWRLEHLSLAAEPQHPVLAE